MKFREKLTKRRSLWHNAPIILTVIYLSEVQTMTENINKKLIDNISVILKKSLSADATLVDLRENKQAGFESIFKNEAGFTCSANTFQPYVQEIADDLMNWQKTQDQNTLISLVKKIEQLFTVLASFEQSYNQ